MRRGLPQRFGLDVAYTRNQGRLPKGTGKGLLPGAGWKGRRPADERSGRMPRLLATLLACLLIPVVLAGLALALVNPRLIRHPPAVIGAWIVGLFLLAFLVWAVVFVRRVVLERQAHRQHRDQRAARRAGAEAEPPRS